MHGGNEADRSTLGKHEPWDIGYEFHARNMPIHRHHFVQEEYSSFYLYLVSEVAVDKELVLELIWTWPPEHRKWSVSACMCALLL